MSGDLQRFRRLVRSRLRKLVAETKEPPPLLLLTSAGARANKALVFHVGAARSTAEVAGNIRTVILEHRPAFAAISSTTHNRESGRRGRGVALVLAARTGETETWQSEFLAGALEAWALGEFDPGATLDLLRSAWAELGRVEHLEGLVERLTALAARVQEDQRDDLGVTEELWEAGQVRLGKIAELGEGCMALLGEQAAMAPRESERDFTAYVTRWVEAVEADLGAGGQKGALDG